MRILIIQPWLSYRGAECVSISLARGLKRLGHEARLATVYVDEQRPPLGIRDVDVITAPALIRRICQSHPILFLLLGPLALFAVVWRSSQRMNLLNAHNPPALLIAAAIGRLRGIPVVWTCHSLPASTGWSLRESILDYFAWRLATSRLERWAVHVTNSVIANSQRTARTVEEMYRRSAVVIHPPLPDDPWRRPLNSEKSNGSPRIIVVGHLGRQKNQAIVIEALAKILHVVPDVELVLAGDGSHARQLQTLADSLGVAHCVRFLGYVPPHTLRELYRTSRVNAVAAVNEAWGLTPFEALSAGCPSIVSTDSGSAELVRAESLGLVCDPTPEAIAPLIVGILNGSVDTRTLVRKGQGYLEHNLREIDYARSNFQVFAQAARNTSRVPPPAVGTERDATPTGKDTPSTPSAESRYGARDEAHVSSYDASSPTTATDGDSSRSVPAEAYDGEYFRRYYPEDGFQRREIKWRIEKALRRAQLGPGMRVLDVGCGPGDLVLRCANAGCLVWGIDYSPAAMAAAQDKIRASPEEVRQRITLEALNAKDLRYPDDAFDVAFLIDVVEHVYPEELELILTEVRRVLRPAGRVVIRTTPNAWMSRPLYASARWLTGTRRWDTEYYHVNEQTPLSLARAVRVLDGQAKVFLDKANDNYFLGHLPSAAGPGLRKVAALADLILDSSLGVALVYKTPVKLILGTELWAVVDLKSKEQHSEREAS